MRYVGCLAPSPAGLLHLGHAATFLTAAARAGAAAGTLLMRLDDLDRQRSRDAFAEAALEDLRWLGLAWTGVVRQSERLPLYRDALGKLLAMGSAYPCVCSRRDLQQATDAPHEDANDEPLYPGHCRPMAGALRTLALQAGMNYRFRVPDGQQVPFTDGNFGPQRFLAGVDFGDFLV